MKDIFCLTVFSRVQNTGTIFTVGEVNIDIDWRLGDRLTYVISLFALFYSFFLSLTHTHSTKNENKTNKHFVKKRRKFTRIEEHHAISCLVFIFAEWKSVLRKIHFLSRFKFFSKRNTLTFSCSFLPQQNETWRTWRRLLVHSSDKRLLITARIEGCSRHTCARLAFCANVTHHLPARC